MALLKVYESTIVPGFRNSQRITVSVVRQGVTFDVETTIERIASKDSEIGTAVLETMNQMADERWANYQNGLTNTPTTLVRTAVAPFDSVSVELGKFLVL